MKKAEVSVGKCYMMLVSGSLQTVELTRANPHGGYDGVNLATRRDIRIKSAAKLRWEVKPGRFTSRADAVRVATAFTAHHADTTKIKPTIEPRPKGTWDVCLGTESTLHLDDDAIRLVRGDGSIFRFTTPEERIATGSKICRV